MHERVGLAFLKAKVLLQTIRLLSNRLKHQHESVAYFFLGLCVVHVFYRSRQDRLLRDGYCLRTQPLRIQVAISFTVAILNVFFLVLHYVIHARDLLLPLALLLESFLSFYAEYRLFDCITQTCLQLKHFLQLKISQVVLGKHHTVHFLH